MATIYIDNLTKRYRGKSTPALNHISLEIQSGMFGLLGKNGAGKSTLLKILTTLEQPTAGSITVNGIAIRNKAKIRNLIGYLPQHFGFYPNMKVFDALTYLAILAKVPPHQQKHRINQLLDEVNLSAQSTAKIKSLSGGMLQRLGIAQALINDPQVLIVDEPTAGLDPEERIRLRNLLTSFAQNRTVILSTHIVSDIAATTNELGILNEGNLIFHGNSQKLIANAKGHLFETRLLNDQLPHFKLNHQLTEQISEDSSVKIRFLSQNPVSDATPVFPTLEEAYLYLQTVHEEVIK